jgi:hypothetical protein
MYQPEKSTGWQKRIHSAGGDCVVLRNPSS